ncbi:Rv1355c family protein [Polluticoccus soli]|uniref:Rv1355c family protein n=1 Tax=Polluticoccus soli TaxID=3034150 RepID=UPI0023E0F06C|nr:Rv1355c family protein [Flavipsychrobacter sp. JY13-12]
MLDKFNSLRERALELKDVSAPELLRLDKPGDEHRFDEIISVGDVFVSEEITDQLKELLKSRNATVTLSANDYDRLIEQHLGGMSKERYGVWAYYPWSKRLVHILDEEEFIEVRTSRNQYKITNTERETLAQKKIGVIGLSVGQSVSVTLAMERGCGELRLADFDMLELTNYNRIRTGLHNLGVKKVVAVAREIAEIDPYLRVICYPDGITEENIDKFISEGGKLDILIDECDGLDIKVLCRQKAKAAQIPVVMEASDRGTVDVERFDLQPDRPILHGSIDHLDVSRIKHLKTNEEKVPYLLPIAGAETISTRAKASMLEIGQSITTWPQLASAVALGGGITADVCRRILLDQYHESGRYFIDIEELIADKKPAEKPHVPEFMAGISDDEIAALIKQAAVSSMPGQVKLSNEDATSLVAAAITAPTGGNSQPWKWKCVDGVMYLFENREYDTHLVDFNSTGSYIGFGAATENLVLQAHKQGLEVKIDKLPLGDESYLIAVFRFFKNAHDGVEAHSVDDLSEVIFQRKANRLLRPRQPIEGARLQKIVDAARTVPGANLQFLTSDNDLEDISDIIAKADRIRIMHEGGHIDFLAEIIWTEEENQKFRKGIDIETLDLTPSERAGFSIARNWDVINYLNKWGGGAGLERMSRKSAMTASAIGFITMPEFGRSNFFDGGRAVERAWLAATKENIAFQPLSISTFLFNRLNYEGTQAFPKKMAEELAELRKKFQRLFSIDKKPGEILLFRVFLTDEQPKLSLRVPVEKVLSFG